MQRWVAATLAAPAPLLFMAGAVSQYVGAAIAIGLFARATPAMVAWLRVCWSGGLLWLAVGRPRWRDVAAGWRRTAAFGIALAAMNLCFYEASARLPLGTAVAIEFAGPIAVAAAGFRSKRNLLALAIATGGIVLLADVRWQASPTGVLLALAAATLWAGYIVLGSKLGEAEGEAEGERDDVRRRLGALAWSMVVGALVIAPFGLWGWHSLYGLQSLHSPPIANLAWVIGGCALVGLASNVVPYSLDQVVLPRLASAQFALLLALLPATAALVGALALRQVPTATEFFGMSCVALAVVLRER